MNSKRFTLSAETITIGTLMVAAVLSLIFLNALIARPKALFGQSLSAISPALFPSIVLVILVLFCAITLLMFTATQVDENVAKLSNSQWGRAFFFFGVLILYGLTMVPFGFLISTALVITIISLQLGSRSVLQIGAVALIGPTSLYLAATRLLAVSLPELNAIEFAYARLFNL